MLTLVCLLLISQETSFRGKILDPARAPIRGALVTAGSTVSAMSDANGEFSLPLDPGSYTVTVSASGFRDASEKIEIPSDPREFVLQVAASHQTVTVTEQA